MPRRAPSTPQRTAIPRVKVWIEIGGDYAFGRGISSILTAIDETGSIKSASRRLRKSYRHVWSRVKEAESALGRPLVISHVGGKDTRRTELTPAGKRLVAEFDRFRTQVTASVEKVFSRRFPPLLGLSERQLK